MPSNVFPDRWFLFCWFFAPRPANGKKRSHSFFINFDVDWIENLNMRVRGVEDVFEYRLPIEVSRYASRVHHPRNFEQADLFINTLFS